MPKSATDLMTDIVTAAMLDGFAALKAASGGLPNAMARDLQAIHVNTAVVDLPAEVQKAIADSTRAAFARLLKEGYAVAPGIQPRPERPGTGGPGPRGPVPPRSRPSGPPVVETRRRPGSPRPGPGPGPGSGPGGGPGSGAPRAPKKP